MHIPDDANDDTIISLTPTCSPCRYEDSLEYVGGRLHWRLRGLVMFLDREDTARVPRQLFEAVSRLEGPGMPGPVYKGLLTATRHFLYMVLLLAFVGLVVSAFGSVYKVSLP